MRLYDLDAKDDYLLDGKYAVHGKIDYADVMNPSVADVVEVVRCKDCIYLGKAGCPRFSPPDDGYCDLGRRSE